ncbi:hypothetical protein [Virgibacillus halodenitrificans]|uniref:Phage tail protein n=1 Tax=Virgibacillus halodenitrificans TaxID=1482 RepID=A0ABR7VLF7_VIRHA|nr:hypothetical protein [Virgibacillus halodenitrificans]MBD1222748.1 hypothetical protein [Virgibacillus halodenitrificans]
MVQDLRLQVGMANITVGGVEVPNQADAAVFSAEPRLIEIDLYTAPVYDRIIEGWDASVTITVDEESYEAYKMALAGVEELQNTGETVGLQDGAGLQSLRKTAQEVIIHPANLPAEDKSFDITLFKAIPTSSLERSYGKEKTSYEITLTALHNTGDYKKFGNYFRIGEDAPVV